jgi:signal transduction histidine kinase
MTSHKLLKRQVSKFLSASEAESLAPFLKAVGSSYEDLEKSHQLLERSMEISSQELFEANIELRLRSSEIEALHKVLTICSNATALDATSQAVLQEISRFTNFPMATIESSEGTDQTMRLMGQVGFSNEQIKKENFWQTVSVGSLIIIPILSQTKKFVGTLTLGHPLPEKSTPRLNVWLQSVATQIGSVLERWQMSETMRAQEANMIAASRMSELGKMAGGMAHEINTPLGTITLLADQLTELICDPTVDKKFLLESTEMISKTAGRIAKIISGLRTFSRDGKSDPMMPTNLKTLVDETVVFCSEKFRLHGVDLRVHVPDDVTIVGRPTQLSQVILNLLNNSYDAIENEKEKWVQVTFETSPSGAVISVMDCGKGISAEVQKKLFDPFYTTKPTGKGTGLGLSISMSIVTDHGGKLVYNENSPNTRFDIYLPK